jgi:hypothetical protein
LLNAGDRVRETRRGLAGVVLSVHHPVNAKTRTGERWFVVILDDGGAVYSAASDWVREPFG